LSRAPMVREHLLKVYESMKPKVNNGDAVPTDPVLIAPDGSKCKLSELLGKTVVYIDIWATWCGPCCREIPHMDKLVERFKGNDAITFVSISRDDNRQAWLKKLERDNPAWPQYIFDKASGDEFMNAMSISGIPRFLLIGKDGKFIAIDAARPSNADIDTILNYAISNKYSQWIYKPFIIQLTL
ncbi:MAG: TlpA family protein disulfide reductase, partial [Duncaniella sp.]|nr:TlpA family protein disulfide reductase [Duncaniella sp.]